MPRVLFANPATDFTGVPVSEIRATHGTKTAGYKIWQKAVVEVLIVTSKPYKS